ncbi:hypothetical protein KRP22_008433 [Phytophthora ramorum]|uniref:uncharacterized protein n=1 Tax=Phytophthora ramorum TaxID=164328 RepID=UPI00309D2283|nr:hypothetical protein KRP23_14681 [Phytophthora ramorum]KAH7494987.1 hypothetical protein KRP22_15184 [Phytophthora ramorum]
MGETEPDNEMETDGDDGDDSYANAYLDVDDAEESDDAELAEMLAKVQSIQQVEGRLQLTEARAPTATTDTIDRQVDKAPITLSPRGSILTDARKLQPLLKSPSAATTSSSGGYKSQDGITTISRSALNARNAGAGTLLGIKKAAIYEEKLLQAVKTTSTIEKLRQKAVATPPATIGKRIETLSAPPTKSTARMFATDDEQQHCRFQLRKNAAQRARASSRDDESAGESGQNFISRMEAAERNRQKKLDLSRGENDYNARLDKKSCPKCETPQSFSEFRDKKKKCQMCGVEFRFLNAWGDIEHSFTSRMAETSRAQAEKREQIYAQMAAGETSRLKVSKTAKQLQYEKRIAMKHTKQTFLDRNYKPNSDSKTKKAQLELEARRTIAQPKGE